MWKTAFKKFLSDMVCCTWKFLKAVFHKFYLVYSWILCLCSFVLYPFFPTPTHSLLLVLFHLALSPAFQSFPGIDISTSKSAGLHAAVQNTVPVQLFVLITQQSTNLIFNNELYLNMKNVMINYFWWRV